MKGDTIKYRKGYKYSLWETYTVKTNITGFDVKHRLFELMPSGALTVFEDYPWDGASGPTIDTPSSIRASLVHDVLFEMMRLELLPQSVLKLANEELYILLLEDGMWKWRAVLWKNMVDKFASAAAAVTPAKVLEAP